MDSGGLWGDIINRTFLKIIGFYCIGQEVDALNKINNVLSVDILALLT